MKRTVLLGLLLAAGAPALALDRDRFVTQYVRQSWQIEQGLPQNTVFALAQTGEGYVWMGTAEGLVRFDGVRFAVLDRRNTAELDSNEVRALLADTAGNLWIGTLAGLVRRDPDGTLVNCTRAGRFPRAAVTALAADAAGTVWAGFDGGVALLAPGHDRILTRKDGLSHDNVGGVNPGPDGSMWISTDGGLDRHRDGRLESIPALAGMAIKCVQPAADGSLWIATYQNGLLHLAGGKLTVRNRETGFPSNSMRALIQDRDGNLWAGTFGAGLLRLAGDRLDVLNTVLGLSNDSVIALLEDREGGLWIGTQSDGVSRLRDAAFRTYSSEEGLSNDSVRAILADGEGAIWIATEGGGLDRLRDGRIRTWTRESGLPDDRVYALAASRDGSLWVGTVAGGVARIRDETVTRVPRPQEPRPLSVHVLAETGDGALWIGTFGEGVFRLAAAAPGGARAYTHFTRAEGLGSDRILTIVEDSRGDLWVGTAGGGLSQFRDGRFTTRTTRDGLPDDFVYAVHEARDGSLWAGTSGGLARLGRDGAIAVVRSRDGLLDDLVYGITEDDAGYLWMICNRGVSRVALADLQAFADGRLARVRSEAFDTQDGLKSPECNAGGRPATRAPDGRLWFATIRGAAVVDPRNPRPAVAPPPLQIEAFLVDGQPVPLAAGASRIGPGASRFELQYSAAAFNAPQQLAFRYRLEPLEAEWVDSGRRRAAYFSYLRPGTYRFHAAACNAAGACSEAPPLAFTLLPYFYQTGWFMTLVALALGLLVLGLYALRIRRLKARERELVELVAARTADLERALRQEEREREEAQKSRREAERQRERAEVANRTKSTFLATMSHELRTPLNAIIGYSELVAEEASDRGIHDFEADLGKIRSSGKHLLSLINDILDLSKIEAGRMDLHLERFDPRPLIEELANTVRTLLKPGVTLALDVPASLGAVRCDPVRLRQVLFNLLSNACKFTAQGSITLAARRRPSANGGERLEYRIRDTGIGIPADQAERLFQPFVQAEASTSRRYGGTGLGLAISRRLCQMMGGDLTLESTPGQGSTLVVDLPAEVRSDSDSASIDSATATFDLPG